MQKISIQLSNGLYEFCKTFLFCFFSSGLVITVVWFSRVNNSVSIINISLDLEDSVVILEIYRVFDL